jgi:hypothetical protein
MLRLGGEPPRPTHTRVARATDQSDFVCTHRGSFSKQHNIKIATT